MELKDLQKLEHGDLVQLYQEGEIGWLEFVMAQQDLAETFKNSCDLFGVKEPTEEIAEQWYFHHQETIDENSSDEGDELERYLAEQSEE